MLLINPIAGREIPRQQRRGWTGGYREGGPFAAFIVGSELNHCYLLLPALSHPLLLRAPSPSASLSLLLSISREKSLVPRTVSRHLPAMIRWFSFVREMLEECRVGMVVDGYGRWWKGDGRKDCWRWCCWMIFYISTGEISFREWFIDSNVSFFFFFLWEYSTRENTWLFFKRMDLIFIMDRRLNFDSHLLLSRSREKNVEQQA